MGFLKRIPVARQEKTPFPPQGRHRKQRPHATRNNRQQLKPTTNSNKEPTNQQQQRTKEPKNQPTNQPTNQPQQQQQQQQQQQNCNKEQQQQQQNSNTHEHLMSPHKAPRVSSLRFSNRSPTWLSPGGRSPRHVRHQWTDAQLQQRQIGVFRYIVNNQPNPEDPWDDCIFTDPWMVDFYGFHVGKYTSPMDPQGKDNLKNTTLP